jgi:UDP-N-acetylmuramoyl-tripeptide--D-alanyl-D-alanine ligase
LKAIATRLGAKPLSFGFAASANVRGEALELADDGSEMTVRIGQRSLRVRLAMPGRHIAENALAVVAALAAIGADLEPALAALAELAPPNGRGARIPLRIGGGEALLIDESYNANPASMRAALATLATVPRQKFARRIAVLGDMLELGDAAPQLHRGLKDAVDEAGVDLIFACGPHMKSLYEALPAAKKGSYALNAAALEDTLASSLSGGDVVMIKASNGTRLGPIVAALKRRFGEEGAASR